MSLYFAYGSNMVRAQMAARCPRARLIGPASLPDHRFAIIRSGHGTILRKRGDLLWGVLWRLGRGDEAALDRYEEIARGLYRRGRCVVQRGGRAVPALVYVAAATARGTARPAYLDAIVAAARRFGFPAGYVAALAALRSASARTSSGDLPLSLSELKVSARSRLA